MNIYIYIYLFISLMSRLTHFRKQINYHRNESLQLLALHCRLITIYFIKQIYEYCTFASCRTSLCHFHSLCSVPVRFVNV
jgi:hypothetical protein